MQKAKRHFALFTALTFLGYSRLRKHRMSRSRLATAAFLGNRTVQDERGAATSRYLQYAIMPLWFVSGVADYICHRYSKIDTTSGVTESFIHSLMMAEAGIPVLAGFYLEANAGLIGLSLAGLIAHQATMLWDVAYAVKRRLVTPNEQHIHGALEMLPFCALSFLICLHWGQFRALFGLGGESPSLQLRRKRIPLRRSYSRVMTGATSILALLYAEELRRCFKAREKGFEGKDSPPAARELYGHSPAFSSTSI